MVRFSLAARVPSQRFEKLDAGLPALLDARRHMEAQGRLTGSVTACDRRSLPRPIGAAEGNPPATERVDVTGATADRLHL